MFKYIDIHAHLNFDDYNADRTEVIKRANDLEVAIINVGTDYTSSKWAVELAEANENMWATVGIHPTENVDFDYAKFKELAKHPKVVAIGECGLDYFHSKAEEIPKQKKIFEEHIALANEVGKPLMLHIRNSKLAGGKSEYGNAFLDAIEILEAGANVKFDFHFFAGTKEDLEIILEMGGSVSFTGVLTFTNDYDELVKNVPLDRMMTETDCPFVAPKPYRGKRNEPSYVVEIAHSIARIRGEDEKIMAKKLVENAVNFFGLKSS